MVKLVIMVMVKLLFIMVLVKVVVMMLVKLVNISMIMSIIIHILDTTLEFDRLVVVKLVNHDDGQAGVHHGVGQGGQRHVGQVGHHSVHQAAVHHNVRHHYVGQAGHHFNDNVKGWSNPSS